jgi:hypothetical protein
MSECALADINREASNAPLQAALIRFIHQVILPQRLLQGVGLGLAEA